MFEKKIRICLNSEEIRILTRSLIDLRNDLIQQGRYTDAVDDVLIKVVNAPIKKFKIKMAEV